MMKFSKWVMVFTMAINSPRCVIGMGELKVAWQTGKTPQEIATLNDALASDYAEVYGDQAA